MIKQPEAFKIRFTKQVTFRDQSGNVLRRFEIGDTCDSTGAVEAGYFVTSMGGIWFDEAEAVETSK